MMWINYKMLWILFGLIICCLLASCAIDVEHEQLASVTASPSRILIFSKTAGFRHGSIESGITAIKKLGDHNDFLVDATEDSDTFTDNNLTRYKVVVFLNTTGNILNDQQQIAFEKFIKSGGGYVGIHAASDTEYDWPWYGKLVGAYFKSHPAIQDASIVVTDPKHISTKHLPKRWQRRDEWYDYRKSPRGNVHVLATLDESSYKNGSMGDDHPIVWCHKYDGGRAWYTGGGHTKQSYVEEMFLKHLLGGIQWAADIRQSS
ncbi:MAG: ThuA domain-containing protein [Planctomycetes bacterium]|nr:ThuA domain-containing protein [Planctomycetota bacterium]